MVTPGACAVVWFRVVDGSGYQASFCPTEIQLGLADDGGGDRRAEGASKASQPGQSHRIVIAVGDETARVTIDGVATGLAEMDAP